MISVAIESAQEAGRFLRQHLGKVRDIQLKGNQEKNLVTEIDKGSEELIIKKIRQHFPQHDILAEESAKDTPRASDYRWIVASQPFLVPVRSSRSRRRSSSVTRGSSSAMVRVTPLMVSVVVRAMQCSI